MERESDRQLTLMAVPHGGQETRILRVRYGDVRRVLLGLAGLALLLGVMVGSWWYLAARAWEARGLELRVAELEADRLRVEGLASALLEVEAAYENLRSLFGEDSLRGAADVWLPPPTGRPPTPIRPGEGGAPTGWPLTERGFLTRGLLAGARPGDEHPGVDVAVPAGSYVLAAGDGEVAEVAQDPIYGLYLVVDHGDGYRTLYGHTSFVAVRPGDRVRQGEVVALSGSSGRSTAPHLHFEILLHGEAVDPLSLVQRP